MRSIVFYALLIVITSCHIDEKLSAQKIIDKTINVSGGDHYLNVNIKFDFRDKHYRSSRNNGMFQYERYFKDSLGAVKDVLSNDGIQRFINNKVITISDTLAKSIASSVNSVHYFAFLPFGLNDSSVNKHYIGDVEMFGKSYYKIKICFNKEGGGEDYEDEFIYWINKKNFMVDYLAYSYNEANDIGIRFRVANNERFIGGLRFVDYLNFKPKSSEIDLLNIEELYLRNHLELVSKIVLHNIETY